jgi:hypothetical protein
LLGGNPCSNPLWYPHNPSGCTKGQVGDGFPLCLLDASLEKDPAFFIHGTGVSCVVVNG